MKVIEKPPRPRLWKISSRIWSCFSVPIASTGFMPRETETIFPSRQKVLSGLIG